MKRLIAVKQQHFPTATQDIAANLIFAVMGETRFNRTYSEYIAIAAKFPLLKVLHSDVNERLQKIHEDSDSNGWPLPEICRFQAGDEGHTFEPYPKTISYETIRATLRVLGMREPRWKKKPL
jgi:hypothetical protein